MSASLLQFIYLIFCCTRTDLLVDRKPVCLLDNLVNDHLPPVVVYEILSYLDDPLILRLLNHETNHKTIKLYKRIVEEEFDPAVSGLLVFDSWSLGCVKFVLHMTPFMREYLEGFGVKEAEEKAVQDKSEERILSRVSTKKSNSLNRKRTRSKVHPVDCVTDLVKSETELIKLIDHFIDRFLDKNDPKPLRIFLDFLNYSNYKLASASAEKLRCLLQNLRASRNGYLPLAYKIILVFGHESFGQAGRQLVNNDDWLDCDQLRLRHLNRQILRLEEFSDTDEDKEEKESNSISWHSSFRDSSGICRGSVRSFQRTCTGIN